MFPVRYELGFYIPEDGILHSYCPENFKSLIDSDVIIRYLHEGCCSFSLKSIYILARVEAVTLLMRSSVLDTSVQTSVAVT
jgi:hypothetical protein